MFLSVSTCTVPILVLRLISSTILILPFLGAQLCWWFDMTGSLTGGLLMSSTDCSLRQARETNSVSMSCENHFDSEHRMRVTVGDKCVLGNSAYQLKSGCLVKMAFVFSIRYRYCISLLQQECCFLLFSVWMKTVCLFALFHFHFCLSLRSRLIY